MFINQSQIERIVNNEKNFRMGTRLQYGDYVEELEIEFNDEENMFEVEASLLTKGYSNICKLHVTIDGAIRGYHCDCMWCNEDSGCAHIAILMYKLIELDPMRFPYHYHKEDSDDYEQYELQLQEKRKEYALNARLREASQFIETRKAHYENIISSMIQQKIYEIEPVFTMRPRSSVVEISFKVGEEKKYVVKDIAQFLATVRNQEYHSYGAKLAFLHTLSVFDEFSQKQIDFIDRSLVHIKRSYYYSDRRTIFLNDDNIDEFYELYSQNESLSADVTFQDKPQKMVLKIQEETGYYDISTQRIQYNTLGKNHLYIFETRKKEITITRIPFDEQGHVLELYNLIENRPLLIPKESYSEFYKYTLSDILDYLDIQSPIEVNMINNDGYIKLYGDIDEEEQVSITLEYESDDDGKRYGFQEDTFANTINQDMVETYIKQYASVIDYDAHTAYLDANEDKTYEFLQEGLPYLGQYCEVFVSNSLQSMKANTSYSISVGVKVRNNLLHIDVNSVDIPKRELRDVLKAYRKKKRFHRLKNGKLLYLDAQDLQEMDTFMMDYNIHSDQLDQGKITMNAYRSFAVDASLTESSHLQVTREASYHELLEKFNTSTHTSIPLPASYEPILRDYQKSGYEWLHLLNNYGFNGILADDMGLGKTLQVIALLESMKRSKRTSLVICPSSLIYNWEDEIHKFSTTLTCACVCGNQGERKALLNEVKSVDILITSYDYLRRDIDLYQKTTFFYVILDEAQYIKNQKTKNAACVKLLKSEHRLALSGTPIENSLAELWSIFDFLMPDYLFNYHYFKTHYESAIVKDGNEKKQKELKRLVTPFILRRNKKDVLKELPDKIENTLTIHFNEEERTLYFAHLAQVNKDLQALTNMEHVDKFAILAMLTKLRQLCCEPRLLFENISEPSSKFTACMELLHTIKDNGQKVLLFSSFTSVLDLLAQALEKEGISYHLLTGQTSKEDRRDLVAKFQSDTTTVFLISLKAGGTGLNLTAAQAVIHFDPWWNLSAQNQATDRAYRIGQEKNVQVYKFIMKDSIEEKIQKLQDRKKNLADSFVEENDGSISTMSTDELLSLFKM